MGLRGWWDRRPGRLVLDGGHWPAITVIEVTPSGLLIEAPAHPTVPIGTVRRIEMNRLRGLAVVETGYPRPDTGKAVYAITIIERDAGLLAEIARQVGRRRGRLRASVSEEP